MKLNYILEDWEKECHLKKDTAMCDSSEIDFLEEMSLHPLLELVIKKICWKVFS